MMRSSSVAPLFNETECRVSKGNTLHGHLTQPQHKTSERNKTFEMDRWGKNDFTFVLGESLKQANRAHITEECESRSRATYKSYVEGAK